VEAELTDAFLEVLPFLDAFSVWAEQYKWLILVAALVFAAAWERVRKH
jgi:hypothetical protein